MVASRAARESEASVARATSGSRDADFEGYLRQLKQRRAAAASASKAVPFGEAFWARLDANISDAKREQMPSASDKTPSQASKSAQRPKVEVAKGQKRKAETPRGSWDGLGATLDAAQKADRSPKAAPRVKGQPGTKSASASSRAPKACRKAPVAEEVFRPPRLLPRPQMKKPVEPPRPLETPGSASGVSTISFLDDDDAPQHEDSREDSSTEVVEAPSAPASSAPSPSSADTPAAQADVEATLRELVKLAEVVEVADAPSPEPPPAEPARPAARMAPGGPLEVEATLRELVKLAEVVEAADLDDQPYPTASEMAVQGVEKVEEVKESDGFEELEGGEEELPVEDDDILSDVEGDAADDRPAGHPSGDDVDLNDIPLLS